MSMKTISTILKLAAFIAFNVFYFSIESTNTVGEMIYRLLMTAVAVAGCWGIAVLLDDAAKREEEQQ